MPQDVEFSVPIPFQVNPNLAAVRERNLQWARTLGAISSSEAAERYLFSQVTDLAAYYYPDADPDDLALAYDLMTWFFQLDDKFTVPAGQHPTAAVADCQEMIRHTIGSPGPHGQDVSPLVAAFADVWARMASGMSPLWRARTVEALLEYLWGNLTEVADARCGTVLGPEAMMELRRSTVGVRISLAMGERVGHFEVPALAWSSSHLEQMRLITTDHTIFVNEVVSLEKEEAAGEANLILALMDHHDLTRTQAIDTLVKTADTAVLRFLDHERQIPQLCERLSLSLVQSAAVRQYAALMSALIRGNYDWSRTAGRYSPGAKPLTPAAQDDVKAEGKGNDRPRGLGFSYGPTGPGTASIRTGINYG
ncbi:terpene synthase family protein [Streptomyces mirabilis]|uniref:terpene synthase family protein n=1 Tax=Streptomyces mirabilis TaxID=68239 RepID=UPI0036801138